MRPTPRVVSTGEEPRTKIVIKRNISILSVFLAPDLNPSFPFFSRLRVDLERFLPYFDNLLFLRVHFPVTCDDHEKCFVSKLRGRLDSVHDTALCVTVVPSLFPKIPLLLEQVSLSLLLFRSV